MISNPFTITIAWDSQKERLEVKFKRDEVVNHGTTLLDLSFKGEEDWLTKSAADFCKLTLWLSPMQYETIMTSCWLQDTASGQPHRMSTDFNFA